MYPLLLMTVAPPSESRDWRERVEVVLIVEQVGVETARSSVGTASRASEGETQRGGEEGRLSGELTALGGGLATSSAMLQYYSVAGWKANVGPVCQPGGGGFWDLCNWKL